jgi:hypothetical protein
MKKKSVHIKIHPLWFDGWFEPTRRKYEKKLGLSLSQLDFTEILAKQNKAKIPKQMFNIKDFGLNAKKFRRRKFII